MRERDYAGLADACLVLALGAGRVQMRHARAGFAVETKADATPVTLADRESERLILDGLTAVAPDIPVIAEEESAAGRQPVIGARFFLVDPLDGTKEFVAGRAEFTINIALIEAGVPVFGLVYAAALGRLFLTLGAAHAIEADVQPDAAIATVAGLDARRIQVRPPDPAALVAVASRSHMNPATEALLARYAIRERRTAGSSLKFCLVAKGEADIYPRIGPTCEWDTAAGHAILRAGGGDVLTLDGAPMLYGKAAQHFRNPDYIAWGCRTALAPRA